MNREYQQWYSPNLSKRMELLVFGYTGRPILFFPTRTARFYDYENWNVIQSLEAKINSGLLQVYCVDSLDAESFYCKDIHPAQRILRHMQYEKYILEEVLPLIKYKNLNPSLVVAGCSLGGYHAVNIALRHPHLFSKAVGMSSRYDLTIESEGFSDLFEGYRDENIYFHTPTLFIPNLTDENILNDIRKLEIIFAVGKEDPFLPNNEFLSECLWSKGIANQLYIWEGEAHRSRYWRQMVPYYL